jgi:hypothetical protein
MKSILLYNLYVKNHWKTLTQYLLKDVPHDEIAINVTLDKFDYFFKKKQIKAFLQKIPKVKHIFFTRNDPTSGEVSGFDNMRKSLNISEFSLLTYMHSKGVTKPDNPYIADWTELMRYFLIDKFDLCQQAFSQGYALYGVNFGEYKGGERLYVYRISDFHFSGNFVSVNLKLLRNEFLNTPCDNDYYGVEGFWGKLCSVNQAYCPHISGIHNHYKEFYPSKIYKNISDLTFEE